MKKISLTLLLFAFIFMLNLNSTFATEIIKQDLGKTDIKINKLPIEVEKTVPPKEEKPKEEKPKEEMPKEEKPKEEKPKEEMPKEEKPKEEKPKEEMPKEEKPKEEKPKEEKPCAIPKEADYHHLSINLHQKTAGKLTINAKLKASSATGTWYLAVGPEDRPAPIIEKKFHNINGTTFTYILNLDKLPDGDNTIFIGFEGTIDGKKCSYGVGYDSFVLEPDHTTKPNKPNNPDKPEKNTPSKGKADLDKLKGGKMPKTATSYPSTLLIGFAFILLSAATLWIRRRNVS
ncbi:hypothetical protein SAMN05444392_101257 [Seinonella peptonophila]|uniref:LPXTG-motif cell wall anchor domain-containing protein n=1 Tax=Seinonella peptonophila TaxID=112248 RepID=A0A1M4T1D7_9BACL|nr:hypothetical protein [Seinonella peptonophila]SHE38249.1 hypothetical protein SAMN05444392_101257 [Seinonella peptonophila]